MSNPSQHPTEENEIIDLRDIFRRLFRGLPQAIGFALLGLAIGGVVYLVTSEYSLLTTSTRVVFSFAGFSKGQYPDGSKFTPDDVDAPDVISEAIQHLGLDTSSEFQSKIRGALSLEGIVPADVVKIRDRIRASGQNPPPYFPDEYVLTLALSRNFPLSIRQRASLLNQIVNAYRDKFQRTYVTIPVSFGSAFEALNNADLFEYEQILVPEIQSIETYLRAQVDQAKDFRSPTTNLSFSDLLDQVHIFSAVRISETLGLIRQNGLSSDRNLAMIKMDYNLERLENQEESAVEQEKVIENLLNRSQDYAPSYVLGIKSQATQPKSDAPLLDQGLIDSLLAHDSYNFLIRKALDAGLKVKQIQSEKKALLERRNYLEAIVQGKHGDQSALMARVQKSLIELGKSYQTLVTNIRNTQSDFANQDFADAIRLNDIVKTQGISRPLVLASSIGLFLGAAFGMGLSLLGIYIGRKRG